jgi:hypothetical protein
MQVTVVVGDLERHLGQGPATVPTDWTPDTEQIERADSAPLAADEAELLDELTRLCRGILLGEEMGLAAD